MLHAGAARVVELIGLIRRAGVDGDVFAELRHQGVGRDILHGQGRAEHDTGDRGPALTRLGVGDAGAAVRVGHVDSHLHAVQIRFGVGIHDGPLFLVPNRAVISVQLLFPGQAVGQALAEGQFYFIGGHGQHRRHSQHCRRRCRQSYPSGHR